MAPSPAWPLEESRASTGRRRFGGPWQARLAQDETAQAAERCAPALAGPRRWGLSAAAVAHLGDPLSPCWRRCRGGCTPRTRDTSAPA